MRSAMRAASQLPGREPTDVDDALAPSRYDAHDDDDDDDEQQLKFCCLFFFCLFYSSNHQSSKQERP